MLTADKNISAAITKLAMDIGQHGPIDVEFQGKTVTLNKRSILALRAREDLRIARSAKGGKKSKTVTAEQRLKLVSDTTDKVKFAMPRMEGIKVSSQLQKMLLDGIAHRLQHQRKPPSDGTFGPRLLFYLDDHFLEFLDGISLGLLASYFETHGNAALRRELSTLEKAFVAFLRDARVGVSTVLNSIVTLYVTSQGLRDTSPEHKGMVRIDDRLRKFLNAPMDSRVKGRSYSKSFQAKTKVKSITVDGGVIEKVSLGGYRQDHPDRSVMDYIRETSSDNSFLQKGYIRGNDVFSIASAHLVSGLALGDEIPEDLSMESVGGEFQNPKVYTITVLQAIVSATNGKDAPASSTPVGRSPSRSPTRSVSRSPTRSVSRSPTRASASSRTRSG